MLSPDSIGMKRYLVYLGLCTLGVDGHGRCVTSATEMTSGCDESQVTSDYGAMAWVWLGIRQAFRVPAGR